MQVNPSYGVSPGNNEAPSSVARQASSGPGVSTSNLDSSRTRLVKRGSVIEFRGGATSRVVRVRLGWLWTPHSASCGFPCSEVRVIA